MHDHAHDLVVHLQRLEAHFNTGKRPMGGHLRLDDSPLDALGGSRASSSVANEVRASSLKETTMRTAGKDKMDRATVEQAIDPRTRMVSGTGHRPPHEDGESCLILLDL